MHLVCPNCAATNRIPDDRLRDEPVCGKCGTELMAARAVDVGDAVLPRFLRGTELPVLVDFWAAWCGPCRQIAPSLEAIAAEHSEQLTIVKLNIDENPATAAKYGVMSIPTLNVYKGGEVVKTIVGAKPKAAIERDLSDYIG